MKKEIVPAVQIAQSIHFLRGQRVLLDFDLAALYEVATGQLNRAVKRNRSRFPADFMFRLTAKEWEILRCQIGISSWGGRRGQPHAFTEQGVAMLSSVLRSERAVQVNIAIMRGAGERTRLACWRWRPRHRGLSPGRMLSRPPHFSARRRKGHARRVRSPADSCA